MWSRTIPCSLKATWLAVQTVVMLTVVWWCWCLLINMALY